MLKYYGISATLHAMLILTLLVGYKGNVNLHTNVEENIYLTIGSLEVGHIYRKKEDGIELNRDKETADRGNLINRGENKPASDMADKLESNRSNNSKKTEISKSVNTELQSDIDMEGRSNNMGQAYNYKDKTIEHEIMGDERYSTGTPEEEMNANILKDAEGIYKEDLSIIREIISAYIEYPLMARKMGWEGTVVVKFTIDEFGNILHIEVVESSGYSLLDEYTVNLIRDISGKFPKPKGEVTIKIPVNYHLN